VQSIIYGNQEIFIAIERWEHWDEIQIGAEKEYAIPKEEFDRLLPEYWKFIGLIAQGYTGLGMFSAIVDKIWHAHILNTLRYEQFCLAICGKMIHHLPNLRRHTNKYPEFTPDCLDPEPGPSCQEPEPEPSCREPEPEPSCKETQSSQVDSVSTVGQFRAAYISTYGEIPLLIFGICQPPMEVHRRLCMARACKDFVCKTLEP
jgi:hypothetical protein